MSEEPPSDPSQRTVQQTELSVRPVQINDPSDLSPKLAERTEPSFTDTEHFDAATLRAAYRTVDSSMTRSDLAQTRLRNVELEGQAGRDKLTGLLNRDGLEVDLKESNETRILVFCDLTNFKAVNDKLGHGAGDEVIVATAQALIKSFRPGDIIARIGGDEFVIIMNPDQEREIAEDTEEFSLEEQIAAGKRRVSHNIYRTTKENPSLQKMAWELAIGGAVWEPGMSYEDVKAIAETEMKKHKADQHEEMGGAYRPLVKPDPSGYQPKHAQEEPHIPQHVEYEPGHEERRT